MKKSSLFSRTAILLYGVIAYGGFLATISCATGFVGDFLVPKSIDSARTSTFTRMLVPSRRTGRKSFSGQSRIAQTRYSLPRRFPVASGPPAVPIKIIVDYMVNTVHSNSVSDSEIAGSNRRAEFMGRVSDAKERLMKAVGELIWTGSYGSTTIDHICEKAAVKKGSFYYFFDSKADLALAALDEEWQHRQPDLDAIFSPTVAPLERLRRYCDYGYRLQAEICNNHGCVLGCPLFSLGAEVCTQENRLRKKIQEILEYKRKYLESAIRDADAAGLIDAPDPATKSRILFAYYQGLQTQARIQNRLDVLKDAILGTYELLGVKAGEPMPA